MALQSFLQKGTLLLFFVSVLFGLVVVSAPVTSDNTRIFFNHKGCKYLSLECTHPIVRKDWKKMHQNEKKKYLDAVNCLAQKPTLPEIHAKFPGTVNRYDDFVAVHNNQTPYIHFVGFFLIWHRYFVATYEKALRDECNYKGAQPYWHTANDIKSGKDVNDWEVFTNDTGFGGNGPYVALEEGENPFNIPGSTGGGCVPGGAFGTSSTFKVNIGPGLDLSKSNPTCLKRDFIPFLLDWCNQNNVDLVTKQPNYTAFARQMENIPSFSSPNIHGGGHFGVGGVRGQMGDAYNSPADPIFHLHHANLDRIYWEWQVKDPFKRVCEVGGPTIPFDYLLEDGPAVMFNYTINIDVMTPDTPVGHLLSTIGGPLCYIYDSIF